MSLEAFTAAAIRLEQWCEEVGIEPLLYTAESLREAILKRKPTSRTRQFTCMGDREFKVIADLNLKRRVEKMKKNDIWEQVWPVTDRFEEFCISQNIRVPSYERVPKKWVLEEFNAIDPTTLSTEQAKTFEYFRALPKEDFDLMFSELYNPFRLSDRKQH